MTLIELVVALAITGIGIASGYQAYATISDRRAIASERADAVARAFALRAMLTRWLSNARLTIEEDDAVFRGVDTERRLGHDEAASADLVFLTSARSSVSNRGTVVHLFVARDSGGLTADLFEWRGPRATRLQFDPAIAGLSIEYMSSIGGRTEPTTSWVSSTILPAAVRLRFLPKGTDTLPALLRLPISVRLEGNGLTGVRA
ncbi:MAG TPA: prepilin-type N-terminal cleavage/methylation domain-containing protein, partial [Gemmatimonadaceae bacterium]